MPFDRAQTVSRVLRRALALAGCLTFAGAGLGLAAQPVDVVFVLDNSGSMRANDPEFLTREAVSDFVEALAAESAVDGRVGIVFFDGRVRLGQPLLPAVDIVSTGRLTATLAGLDYSGARTDSPAGIERALYELRERGRDEARKAIVFLTDGKIDTGDERNDDEVARWLREDLASESAESDIHIFGIAFTESADYQLMQALALRTRARYYRAFAPGELGPVVDDALSRIAADPTVEHAYDVESKPATSAAPAPEVAAAPFPPSEAEAGPGLVAWGPIFLFLVGAGYLAVRRNVKPPPSPGEAAPLAAQLLDLGGQIGTAGESRALNRNRTTIGRDPNNDVVIEDDTISSEHAAIEVRDGRYWLEDLRSTNGTRLGDRRLADGDSLPLKGGDHVRLADIDLMFVVEGYVPGGATVYLSSSTRPPADGSVLANAGDPMPPPAERTPFGEVPSADTPRVGPDEDAPSGEIAFAVQRERLDPAEVVDLDERLEDAAVAPDSAAGLAPPVPSETAVERAESALASIEALTDGRPPERRNLELVIPPPEEARPEETPPLPSAGAVGPTVPPLATCLSYHLARVAEISPDFREFVDRAFPDDLRQALPVTALDVVNAARRSGRTELRPYTRDRIRYVVCGVPGAMTDARDRFVSDFGGFTRVLTEHLQDPSFSRDRCQILALLTCGFDEQPWVSLSIVPDEGQDPRIDLLSYEFLTDEERREIEPQIDPDISQSGLA
ncbi:MAG: FHA domain-containing protein [Myxococcota bacterium]